MASPQHYTRILPQWIDDDVKQSLQTVFDTRSTHSNNSRRVTYDDSNNDDDTSHGQHSTAPQSPMQQHRSALRTLQHSHAHASHATADAQSLHKATRHHANKHDTTTVGGGAATRKSYNSSSSRNTTPIRRPMSASQQLLHKSPLRRSGGGLGKHIEGSQYCIDAGLHDHSGIVHSKPSTTHTHSRPYTASKRVQTHTHQQQRRQHRDTLDAGDTDGSALMQLHYNPHPQHGAASYHELLRRLTEMRDIHEKLLHEEREKHRLMVLDLERRRNVETQNRLIEAERALRDQLLQERQTERDLYSKQLTEKDGVIKQLETQWHAQHVTEVQTIGVLRNEIQQCRDELQRTRHDYERDRSDMQSRIERLQSERNMLHDASTTLRADIDSTQKSVLSLTEENLRLRSKNKECHQKIAHLEDYAHRMKQLDAERAADDERLKKLRDSEAVSGREREQKLKEQLQYAKVVEERKRQAADRDQNERALMQHQYFRKGDPLSAWLSGPLNRELLFRAAVENGK